VAAGFDWVLEFDNEDEGIGIGADQIAPFAGLAFSNFSSGLALILQHFVSYTGTDAGSTTERCARRPRGESRLGRRTLADDRGVWTRRQRQDRGSLGRHPTVPERPRSRGVRARACALEGVSARGPAQEIHGVSGHRAGPGILRRAEGAGPLGPASAGRSRFPSDRSRRVGGGLNGGGETLAGA